MKKAVLLFLAFSFCVHISVSQTVIENPEKPLSSNPGRVIRLKEVMRIVDEGRDFYFKLPWGLGVAEDGSVFVQDGVRLFKFDQDGKFVKNIVREGQGPGEITTELTNFVVKGNEVLLLCGPMSKIIHLDLDGKLVDEIIIEDRHPDKAITHYHNKYLLFDFKVISFERKEGERPLDHYLFFLDKKGAIESFPYSFPTKSHIRIRKRGGRAAVSGTTMTQLEFLNVQNRFLYISHTHEYLIKQFDLKTNQMGKMISRDYPRAEFEADEYRPFKYYNDVHCLLSHKNNLWVLTSTFNKEKGVLVDVFSEEGNYLDNFHLPLLSSKTGDSYHQLYFPVMIQGDYLYAIEHDEDWAFSVAKYEIID
jgi:hypothetical protein